MSPPVEIGRDEARRRAEEELAKAKYQGMPQWLEDFGDWLLERLESLFELVDKVYPNSAESDGSWALGLMGGLVLLALVAAVVKFGIPRWRPKVKDAVIAADESASPGDYRQLAEAAAARGDWQLAIRERFRAMVRMLEDHTIIDPRPARTALEAAGLGARMLPQVEPDLHGGALIFNDVMYGDREGDAAGYAAMVAVDQSVQAAAEKFRHPDDEDELDSSDLIVEQR